MTYSAITLNSDPKVIGVKNGIYQIEIDRKSLSKKAYDEIYDQLANLVPEKNKVDMLPMKLLSRAKITDFMGYSPNFKNIRFAVTEKCLNVLRKFNLKPFCTIDIRFTNGHLNKCYLFWYSYTEFSSIDFERSLIFTGSEILGKKYFDIKSLEEFMSFIGLNPLFSFEKIALKEQELEYDLLVIRAVGVFVSERLKREMIEVGLTGLEFNWAFGTKMV